MMSFRPDRTVLCNARVFIDDGAYFCDQVDGHLTAHEVLTGDADRGGVQVSWASTPPPPAKPWEGRDRAQLAFNRLKAQEASKRRHPSMRRPLRLEGTRPATVVEVNWAAREIGPDEDEEY